MRAIAEILAEVVAARRPSPRVVVSFGPHDAVEALAISAPRLLAIQPWRPSADALSAARIETLPEPPSGLTGADVTVVWLGRQRRRNLATIAAAVTILAPDGLLVIAGDNDVGPASYARHLKASGSRARAHGRVIWASGRDAVAADDLARWREDGRLRPLPDADFVSAPGLFAWDRVDPGSALLTAALPRDLAGAIADLGAGWGYLSRHVLMSGVQHPTRLDAYEADWHALEAARANLASWTSTASMGFFWHDVTQGLPHGDYDAIVSNPPFHDARTADTAIGRAFIGAAHAALRPGGRLWLVANRTLPYEEALRSRFARVTITDAGDRYKIVEARR